MTRPVLRPAGLGPFVPPWLPLPAAPGRGVQAPRARPAPRCPPLPSLLGGGRPRDSTAAGAAASAPRPRARPAAGRSAGRAPLAPRLLGGGGRPRAAATGAPTPACARSAPRTAPRASVARSRPCRCGRGTVEPQVSGGPRALRALFRSEFRSRGSPCCIARAIQRLLSPYFLPSLGVRLPVPMWLLPNFLPIAGGRRLPF